MEVTNYYYKTIIKQDLINKFNYKKINNISQVKKIILNIEWEQCEMKNLLISLLSLELITLQKSIAINRKKSKIYLKIKKGIPNGCKITLKKNLKYKFMQQLTNEIFPKLKQFNNFKIINPIFIHQNAAVTFSLVNILNFPELESNYSYFTKISSLNVTIVTTANNPYEFFFLLKSFKFPLIFPKLI